MPRRKSTKKILKKSIKKTRSSLRKFSKAIRKNTNQARTLIIIGIIFILISTIYHVYEITKYSFTTPPPQTIKAEQKRLPRPSYITIQGTDMSFPVFETVIQNGVWQIADNGASHLGISARPGENGAIIIYAHNTLVRFGSLPYVYPGQRVSLITQDKKDHEYVIRKTQIADPNDTKILTSQKGEVLIMYTCYGFADLQRFVVFAYPVEPVQTQ